MYQGPTYREVEELAKLVEEFIERFNMSLIEFKHTLYFEPPSYNPYNVESAKQDQIRLKQGFKIPLFRFLEMYLRDTGMTAKDFKAMLEDVSKRLVHLENPITQERYKNT